MSSDKPLSADLLLGVRKISRYLGLTERQVFHQIERGNLPVRRMGRLIVGSKSALRRHFIPEGDGKSA